VQFGSFKDYAGQKQDKTDVARRFFITPANKQIQREPTIGSASL
jgi:hypothetical protein